MANDNEVKIQSEIDISLKNPQKINSELHKVEKEMFDILDVAEELSKQVNILSKGLNGLKVTPSQKLLMQEKELAGRANRQQTDLEYKRARDAQINAIRRETNKINKLAALAKSQLADALTLKATVEDYHKESKKASREEWTIGQAYRNAHKDELLAMQKESQALYERAIILQEANRKEKDRLAPLTERRLAADVEMKEYRNAHKDLFTPQGRQPRYIVGRGISNLGQSLKGSGTLGRVLGDIGETIGKMIISPVAGGVTALVNFTKAIHDISKAAIEASSQIEMLKTNLSVVFGSETQSESAFRGISQYAIKSPFGIEQTTEMAILLKQSGVYASDLIDTLRMIGDTAGGNAEKMKRIANNYAQIVSIGKASMLDMRQFAYAGIPIFEAVSKELGVSQAQLRKLISDGKVTSDIIEKVFKDLTGVNGLFENATEKGAKTFKARLQNLKDAQQLALASVGDLLLGVGASGDKESLAKQGLGVAEDFYQWLERWTTIKNIERDVKILAENRQKAGELEGLAGYYTKKGNVGLAMSLQELADKMDNFYSKDAERGALAALYESKVSPFKELTKNGVHTYYEGAYNSAKTAFRTHDVGLTDEEVASRAVDRDLDLYKEEEEALSNSMKKAKELFDAFNESLEITTEQLIAYREVLLQNSQQAASDLVSKSMTKTGSVFNTLSEIKEAYSKTEEAKVKAEKEKNKRWDEAIRFLKEVSEHTDEKNRFSASGLSFDKVYEYLTSGAIGDSRELNILNTDRGDASAYDIDLARKQYISVKQALLEELERTAAGKNDSVYQNLRTALMAQVSEGDAFVKQFTAIQGYAEDFTDTLTEYGAKRFQEVFGSILLELNIDKEALSWDLTEIASDSFIPLWKRIEASALGLDPKLITGSEQALDMFNDKINRNIVGNILAAGLKSKKLSVEDISNFYANNILKDENNNLAKGLVPGDQAIYQTGWGAAGKAAAKMAGGLFSNRGMFNAYEQELKGSRDKLINLLGVGLTTGETQGVSGYGKVSFKDASKVLDLTGEAAINAFGNSLVDKDGLKVQINEAGEYVNELGKKLEETDVFLGDKIFKKAGDELKTLNEELGRLEQTNLLKTLGEDIIKINKNMTKEALNAPLELVGKNLGHIIAGYDTWDNYNRDLAGSMKQIVAASLQQIGPAMTTAGFQIAGSAALQRNWGMVAAGLAIAGAGGIVNGIGTGMMENPESERDKSDEDYKKAQQLKDQLADLLAQARSDALYYEQNLRHKTALGINKEFSLKSVNDAIISPSGDVITTHPDDYLIATKTPQALGSPNITVQPKISFKVENKAGSNINVRQEERQTNDGSIEVVAVIEQVVSDYISSSRSDDAFMAREARGYGVRSIM